MWCGTHAHHKHARTPTTEGVGRADTTGTHNDTRCGVHLPSVADTAGESRGTGVGAVVATLPNKLRNWQNKCRTISALIHARTRKAVFEW